VNDEMVKKCQNKLPVHAVVPAAFWMVEI